MTKCDDCNEYYYDTDENESPWHEVYCRICDMSWCLSITSNHKDTCTGACRDCKQNISHHTIQECNNCFTQVITCENDVSLFVDGHCEKCRDEICEKAKTKQRLETYIECKECGFEFKTKHSAEVCKDLQRYRPSRI